MNKIHEWVNTGLIVLVAILVLVGGNQSAPSLGGSTSDSWSVGGNLSITGTSALTGGVTVGSSGTASTNLAFGTCNINAAATTIAASSTVTVDCGSGSNGRTALTGVQAADTVFLHLATTTPTTFGGLRILGYSASSTTGYLTALIYNETGATFTWTAAASSSLQWSSRR